MVRVSRTIHKKPLARNLSPLVGIPASQSFLHEVSLKKHKLNVAFLIKLVMDWQGY
jgi:hypothetical protein